MKAETPCDGQPSTSENQCSPKRRASRAVRSPKSALGMGAMALAVFGLGGCDTGPLQSLKDDIEVRLNVPGLSSSVSLQFIDPSTGATITEPIQVVITGPDAGAIVDPNFFDAVDRVTVNGGVLSLGIRDSRVPSSASPVRANLFVSAPGFVSTSFALNVDQTGSSAAEIALVRVSSPPVGVAAVQQTSTLAGGGVTTAPINLQTPTEPVSGGTASVVIAQGTALLTSEGFPLQGQISSQLSYYNNRSPDALAAFPGGFQNVQMIGFPEGPMVTAGFISVQLTDGQGRRAANLSQAAQLTIPVIPGTINPVTGQPVVAGDRIPLWSMEPEVGRWLYEGEQVVQSAAAVAQAGGTVPAELSHDALMVQFDTDHFTARTISWWSGAGAETCVPDATVALSHPLSRGSWLVRISGEGFSGNRIVLSQTAAQILRLPASRDYTVEGFFGTERVLAGTFTYAQLCGQTVTLNVPEEFRLTPATPTYDIDVELECRSGSTVSVIRPSRQVSYRKEGESRWIPVTFKNGRVTESLALDKGARYEIMVDVLSGGSTKNEVRSFRFTESPTSADLGPNVRLVSSTPATASAAEAFRYRISGVPELCP